MIETTTVIRAASVVTADGERPAMIVVRAGLIIDVTDLTGRSAQSVSADATVEIPEGWVECALRMARNFVDKYPQVTGSRQKIEELFWNRISTSQGGPHDHAFTRGSAEVRTTVVTRHGVNEWVISGLRELTVLKTTGSEFQVSPGRVHLAGRDDRSDSGHRSDRAVALHRRRARLGQHFRGRPPADTRPLRVDP